jgi:polysaccharide export outer membrane protein
MEGDSLNNIALESEDEITIYSKRYFFPEHTVSVWGAVRNSGSFPRHDNMTVSDLVVMAGGLREDAMFTGWELSRMETTKVGVFSKVTPINASKEYWKDEAGGAFLLSDFDVVNIPSDPRYTMPKVVEVKGRVMYPGTYTIRFQGEKLADILKRAGGLRAEAYLEGSKYFRKQNNAGLVPVDFVEALDHSESIANIAVVDGDAIEIAEHEDVVYVRGEVFTPMAVLYEKGEGLEHYLEQAGGMKETADDDRVYVILPNGRKWEPSWCILPNPEILAGSTVHVPLKIEKEDNTLPVLRDWATIALSIATMAIAIVQVTK